MSDPDPEPASDPCDEPAALDPDSPGSGLVRDDPETGRGSEESSIPEPNEPG